MKKKGIYFTLDALFATILISVGIILSLQYTISDTQDLQVSYLSRDIVKGLSTIKVSEINDSYVQALILSGDIENPNNTIIEQIGEFYVLNNTELAKNLSMIITEKLIPDRFGIEILVNGETIFINDSSSGQNNNLVSSRRLISGMEKFKPLEGATSKVFLEGINSRRNSDYLYFGGFVGQGNITMNTSRFNTDVVISNAELELDVAGDFNLYINEVQCDMPGGTTFLPKTNSTIAERWDISSCIGLFSAGEENKIEIEFDDLFNESYVTGGFLRVDFDTQELSDYFEGYKVKYNFPGIVGIANIYDAFYVPGTITNMTIYLHFKANETSYLTIGSRIIHKWPGNETDDQEYFITNDSLATLEYSNLALEYLTFSNNTVPIRFASYEDIIQLVKSGDADVILITDLSGSMKKAVADWTLGDSSPTCDTFEGDPDTRRTRAAVCLDLDLVNVVMNYTGNRLWPVYMRDNEITYYDNPEDKDAILNNVNTYYNDQGKDYTCLACAINQGYNLLEMYSNESRKKFMVLMTDGVPTHCAFGGCTSNSTLYGAYQCDGLCDDGGSCDAASIALDCLQCTTDDGAVDNALYSAQRLKDDLNATIYTIGFGPMSTCQLANNTMKNIADIGNGTYQESSDTAELKIIYQNISQEIITKVAQPAQPIIFKGNLTYSTMYPDSYIEVEYIPIAEQPAFDEIALSIEEDKFDSCSPSFDIPSGMRITDAKVTSYSGEHWTDSLVVNGLKVYNLTDYFLDYGRLGDPFFVYVPVNFLTNGTNTLKIETADSITNKTGCSLNNTIIYTGLIKSSVSYAAVLPNSEGCSWEIEFYDGTTSTINIPQGYAGTKTCYYTTSSIEYDQNDSVDLATYKLLNSLDYYGEGRVFVNIDEHDLVVSVISLQNIPYPWGPAIAEVRVWR